MDGGWLLGTLCLRMGFGMGFCVVLDRGLGKCLF